MSISLINEILKGIAKAIRDEFGESFNIYLNEVEQGLIEPCFFISVLNPEVKQVLGRRYVLNCPVSVQFISEEDREVINAQGSRLFNCLELISVSGDLVRGRNMSYSVNEDILTFTVTYNIYFYKKQEKESMESLKQETEV